MSEELENIQSEKLEVIPHQDFVRFTVFDDVIHITQEDFSQGDQTIYITGKTNLDLMIAALQKVREKWS